MSKKTNKNHFSPVFANKNWTNEECGWVYSYYYFCKYRNKVVKANRDKGKTAWGYETDLYSQSLESSLDLELENDSALLYQKLIDDVILSADERMKWSKFIITQSVRTPSFFRYRDIAADLTDGDLSYRDTIVGCIGCHDNKYIACRNWVVLEAADGDFFVRTDNPVYMTGFLENPTTVIFYPLSPKKCFVACSTIEIIPILKGEEPPFPKQNSLTIEKGDAYYINFELVKSTSSSLILATQNDNKFIKKMNLEVLGSYPQIPFLMSKANNDFDAIEEQEHITKLMEIADGVEYPYREYPFTPFYGMEFTMGINPFSVLGVTECRLPIEKT